MKVNQLFHSIQTKFFDAQPTLLTNTFFNSSQLKARIKMLVNPKTNRGALWGYALVLPVSAALLMCSQKDPVQASVFSGAKKEAVLTNPPVTGEVFTVVEQNPEPVGGMASLGTYLSQQLHYPEAARKAHVEGKVFVRFVVSTEGRISDIQILKGIGFGCDAEAVRVVSQMPRWTPGRQSGKAVNVRFNLPIRFALSTGISILADRTTDHPLALSEDNKPVGIEHRSEEKDLPRFDRFFIDGKEVNFSTFNRVMSPKTVSVSKNLTQNVISLTTK